MLRSRGSADHALLCAMLRDHRVRQQLTQIEVAERLERPQSFVSKYESGERRLDVIELSAVCSALDLAFDEFILEWQRRRPRS